MPRHGRRELHAAMRACLLPIVCHGSAVNAQECNLMVNLPLTLSVELVTDLPPMLYWISAGLIARHALAPLSNGWGLFYAQFALDCPHISYQILLIHHEIDRGA